MENKFKQVYTAKDIAISVIVLLLGIGLFFVNKGVGILMVVIGLCLLIFLKTGWKQNETGPVLKKKAFDVDQSCRVSILAFLEGRSEDVEIKNPQGSGVVRLEVYYNEAEKKAFAQLFDFSSYIYVKATEVVDLPAPKAEKLISKI